MNRDLNLLFPLDTFYERDGLPLPSVQEVPGEDVPQPYHRLLCAAHDMTPTLESFHGEPIDLSVLERRVDTHTMARLVVLTLRESRKPVEFGAIIINLNCFPPEARALVLEGQVPLGTILGRHCIAHLSCPQAYLRVASDERMNEALRLTESSPLYGRRNYLVTPEGLILADIIELLPPHVG